jgi:hypothetical protein
MVASLQQDQLKLLELVGRLISSRTVSMMYAGTQR